jgi:hypothetical protein
MSLDVLFRCDGHAPPIFYWVAWPSNQHLHEHGAILLPQAQGSAVGISHLQSSELVRVSRIAPSLCPHE